MKAIEFFEADWNLESVNKTIEKVEENLKEIKENPEKIHEEHYKQILSQLNDYLNALKGLKQRIIKRGQVE